jgi:pimeloyl-ACP methyl ester carboxylesterase
MEELLDALKWNRVVLVGCDSEAALTVQAAIRLAPSGRVAGLVLCGDLATLQDEILQSGWDITVDGIRSTNRLLIDNFVVDLFLRENVQCPFTVVWAGDAPSLLPNVGAHALAPPELDAVEAMLGNRYVILGGGAAPHRRRPELFAWVLTRFVEEKIADTADARSLQQRQQPVLSKRGGQQDSPYGDDSSSNPNAAPEPRPLNRLVRLQEFFSPGSFLVTGRVVATMIFYWAIMKVGIHQFDNICAGMVNVQSAVKHVQNWRATTFRFVGRLLSKIGGLFLITSYSSTTKATSSSSASSTLSEPKDADSSGIPESDGALGGPNGTNSSVITSAGDADPRNPTPESSSASPDDASLSPPIADESDEDPRRGESDASAPEREKERRKPLFFLDHVVA